MDGNQTPASQPELPTPIQPGQTVSPGSAPTPAPSPAAEQSAPQAPIAQTPEPVIQPAETAPTPSPVLEAPLSAGSAQPDAAPLPASGAPVSWTASEFIAHEKSGNWYVLLFGGAVIAAIVVWLITKDVVSAIVIVLAVGVLAAYARRIPRELQYVLNNEGITIGEKHYPYTNFRSFSVIEDGAFSCIELFPFKRFSPPISVYYDPANEEAIAAALTPHLPFEQREPDAVDKLMRRIRF